MSALSTDTIRRIDGILREARAEGRGTLFEHEVYGVCAALGLAVPRFVFVRDATEVTSDSLSGFGHALVAKIVSPDVLHKQKLGGVRKIAVMDPLFVQFVLSRMREEVLSHFTGGAPPEIAGFLLVEHVPHTQALGYEVLIGFREDPAFGPVLTVSKGGDDAEFFAAHYDPANLFLPPMELSEALSFTRSLHIRHKFEQAGHPEYLALMAQALAAFSALSLAYSPMAEEPGFIFKAFEVNPFAISKSGRFVALDGLAEFSQASDSALQRYSADSLLQRYSADSLGFRMQPNIRNLEAFFTPKGVAVIGVSADLAKYNPARDIAEQLHELARDDLFLVNPRGGSLRIGSREYPLYRDLSEAPGPVELAVYAAPAQSAPGFLGSIARSDVRAVILIPGIPASVSYAEYAKRLKKATPPGVRVMGPNCLGVYFAAATNPRSTAADINPRSTAAAMNTLFINEKRLEVESAAGANAALLTQSGALAVTAIDKLRNCRPFRAVASFGNSIDVNAVDLLAYFEQDPSVEVIAVYLEGLDPGEGRAFFEKARETTKPIIAYKGGRTEAGARSAATHTASMSGDYGVFRAACGQAGVILAETIEGYYDLIRTFSLLAAKRSDGRSRDSRVAGVVNAGFESTVGADELSGLSQAVLSPRTIQRLGDFNRHGLVDTSSPFLDLTPMADDAMYAGFVEAVMSDEGVDCVFVAIVPHATSLKTVPETCRDPDGLACLLAGIGRRHSKPMVVSVNAGRYYADFVAALEESGLPVYADLRSAITCLGLFMAWPSTS